MCDYFANLRRRFLFLVLVVLTMSLPGDNFHFTVEFDGIGTISSTYSL